MCTTLILISQKWQPKFFPLALSEPQVTEISLQLNTPWDGATMKTLPSEILYIAIYLWRNIFLNRVSSFSSPKYYRFFLFLSLYRRRNIILILVAVAPSKTRFISRRTAARRDPQQSDACNCSSSKNETGLIGFEIWPIYSNLKKENTGLLWSHRDDHISYALNRNT